MAQHDRIATAIYVCQVSLGEQWSVSWVIRAAPLSMASETPQSYWLEAIHLSATLSCLITLYKIRLQSGPMACLIRLTFAGRSPRIHMPTPVLFLECHAGPHGHATLGPFDTLCDADFWGWSISRTICVDDFISRLTSFTWSSQLRCGACTEACP